jgi:tetratricopeptide (TPR) repeat protein
MLINLNTITGFLGGSLTTVVVGWLLNSITKKQEFKRELIKATYLRKLEKAEKAVAYYYTYVSKVIELKKSLEVIIQAANEFNEKDRDIQVIQAILEQNSKMLMELAGDKYGDVNSVHLYFDLEDKEKWNEQDFELLLKSLTEAKTIDNDIQFWTSMHNSSLDRNEVNQAEQCWNKAIGLLPNYVISLQEVVDVLEKNKIATSSMIANIKSQLEWY